MRDLSRYLAAVGAEYAGPYGRPWRAGKEPYSQSSLDSAAACLKRFYQFQGTQGANQELAGELDRKRLPSRADRRRMFLGHVARELPANPLRPAPAVRRRHPKMLADGAREALTGDLRSPRDKMIVTWLGDGGFRVGELCGLHLIDLHLREKADCGECVTPHVHICHRELNPNKSRAKAKHPWVIENGVLRGGQIRRASPAMVHAYFEYLTTEYPADAAHGMLLVQLKGPQRGEPLSTAGVRQMMGRAGGWAWAGRIPMPCATGSRTRFSTPRTATSCSRGMRAAGLRPRRSRRPTATPISTIRRSWRRSTASGASRDHAEGPGKRRRHPDQAGPAGAADGADDGTGIRPALPQRPDRDPAPASGLRLGVRRGGLRGGSRRTTTGSAKSISWSGARRGRRAAAGLPSSPRPAPGRRRRACPRRAA